MKKIGLILSGILVGILLTNGIQELAIRRQPSYRWLQETKKAFELRNAKDISSDSFLGVSSSNGGSEEFLLISKDHPFQNMTITKLTAINATNHNINIQDGYSSTVLRDVDFDGVWDHKFLLIGTTLFIYGKESGFPIHIRTMSNETVRINGRYHDLHKEGGEQFVIVDGDKLEVDSSDIDHLKLNPWSNQGTGLVEQDNVKEELQEYQMNLIREGMPPLPVPLTQEMDDQLVKEGILPPKEK